MPADTRRMLVTGGAGFIGSHLIVRLLPGGLRVGVDNLSTGTQANLDASRRTGLRRAELFMTTTARRALSTRLAGLRSVIELRPTVVVGNQLQDS